MSCNECENPCIIGVRNQQNARLSPREFFICRYPQISENITSETRIEDTLNALVENAQESAASLRLGLGQGSINRNRGELYELLLYKYSWQAVSALDISDEYQYFILKMPSSTPVTRFISFFAQDIRNLFRAVPIFLPNPDLFILKYETDQFLQLTGHTDDLRNLVTSFANGYEQFRGNIGPSNLVAVVSVKTTTRPDRRYQCVYEAHIIDSIFERLNRYVPYFVFGLSLTDADKEVLSSPSVACISNPECTDFAPIICCHYDVTKVGDCIHAVSEILEYDQSASDLDNRDEAKRHWSSICTNHANATLDDFMQQP